MRVVGVEHFRSAMDQPPLDRIAEISARNRRRHIAEGIGAVRQRLVLEAEIFVLQVHLIDTERLAAIVQRPAARTIGIRQRIALRQEVAFFIQRTERFVADLVIEEDELAEVRARSRYRY